jgi:GntR family transcriptional regulator, sialic acid-inducible nan operon repressor
VRQTKKNIPDEVRPRRRPEQGAKALAQANLPVGSRSRPGPTGREEPAAVEAPVPRRKLSGEVFDRLLARITAGEFPPGSHLPSERELMERLGVGRPSVREALQALERMGFVTIVHGEGARVQPLSAQDVIGQMSEAVLFMLANTEDMLEHLKEARLMFEVAMARLAAQRATKADIERLRLALETHRASLDDPQKFLETDLEFHASIAAASHNPIYVAVSTAMLGWLRRFHVEAVQTRGAEQLTYSEHHKLFELIAAHDADGAEKWLTMHVRRASKKYQRFIQSGKPASPSGAAPKAR